MPSSRLSLAILCFVLLAAASSDESRRLAGGEVLVTLRPIGAGPTGPKEGIGRGVIEAPPERVFRAVTDLDHWDEFMPFLEESDARRQRDGSVLSFQRLALPRLIGERRFEIRARSRTDGRAWIVEWSHVPGSGNIAAHRGSWTLVPFSSGRTLATLRLYTNPGGSAWGMDRATGKSLVWIFDGLRQHVRRSRYDNQ